MNELKGRLKITKFGFGIIINKFNNKIRVDKKDLNNNFNGDEVTYIVKKDTGKTIFAEIVSQPNYKNREFNGIVHHTYKKDVFVYNFNIGRSNLVLCDCMKQEGKTKNKDISKILNENNFVKFCITKYKDNLFYGKVIKNYGTFYDDNALSIYTIDFYNLKYEFSKNVIKKAKKCESKYYREKRKERKIRKDLSKINTFTIDPNGARDLDDAISIQKIDNVFKLFVHIADVSYFVDKGSSIDKDSRKRSFSVYLPNQVIRMLPPVLSEGLCSLLPDSDKYAVTTEIDIDEKGEVLKWDIYKSIIRSNYKYTYEEVYDILENNKDNDYLDELKLLYDLSIKLKKKRLKLPDKKLNDSLEMDISYSDYSHSMIEEMMILNNILVAKTLYGKTILYPARYHNQPNLESSNNMLELVEKINNMLISDINVDKLQYLVDVENDENKLINLFFIQRILSKAIYDCKETGHWALNLEFYSHFTSPIRRYPDLISHRLIFGDNYKEKTLKNYLNDINNNEKHYQQIEFFIDKVKLIRQLNKSQKNSKIFNGYILEVKNPTVIIFIPVLFWIQEMHISEITSEKMSYDYEKNYFFNYSKIIDSGIKLNLKIDKIKVALLEIDFKVLNR